MSENRLYNSYVWDEIASRQDSLRPVPGGFSLAKRGLVTLPEGDTVFVKIGSEENSKRWATKELQVYEYLRSVSYAHIPEVLSESADKTAFALEALTEEEGWDWSNTWTKERVDATLAAMDQLALLKPDGEDWINPDEQALDATRDGWLDLVGSPELQKRLLEKLNAAGYKTIADGLDFERETERSSQFTFRTDTLVHFDVRADNCAWNAEKNEVKLVDWNWAQLGDVRVDQTATLVNVQRGGFDVMASHADRLNADALQWLAGFWLRGAATPIWDGGAESLRDFQLEAGIASLNLLSALEP